MSEFRFAEPGFVHGLWAVAAFVVLLVALERRGGSALDSLIAAPLRARLVRRPGAARRGLRIALLGLAGLCCVLALMRPQWGMRVVSASRVGAEIMIALDVSRSMLAEDVAPNRLERAKAEVVDLLSYLEGDQVGLIAFAGRASVLCPLTPDFGFLRLVLEETGSGSVTRGGSKLAEPIRKAVQGFGPSEGAARAILLITDGEDHDSFAVDAAREAAEAGIKIIAIGFGDESGSEIRVTDPRTGARTLVRDADGRPVRTRLDGDVLRELALATDGAYVPAGTGVLDLESIYEEHVARLTRGQLDGTRTVRDEGYPWFVLLAVVFLVSSAIVSAGRLREAILPLALALALGGAPPARAQPSEEAPAPGPEAPATAAEPPETAPPEIDLRGVYNDGVEALSSRDFDQAERLLERARQEAGGDDELRYHAAYNLGWVGVQQSGRVQGQDPQQALRHLYRAADWFREAVRLRPESDAARQNLEVTLKRALVLADELARQGAGEVEGALAELVERQRALVAGVAGLLEAAHAAGLDPLRDGEELRGAFRAHATSQRAVLSDADQLASRVGAERDAIASRPEEERAPEDGMRGAQLGSVLEHLHRARERMGQARRQLRQRQGDRAYRRTSSALAMLKRARDQLRDPAAVLEQLVADGTGVMRGTAALTLSRGGAPDLSDAVPEPPPWLTVEGLADEQRELAERTAELQGRLAAGLAQQGAVDPGTLAPEQAELLAAVREAEPLVRSGSARADEAAVRLGTGEVAGVPEIQAAGLRDLADARERFLDLRGLVEAAYREEVRISEIVTAEGPEADAERTEFVPALQRAQSRNLERAGRLEAKLEARSGELEALSAAVEDGSVEEGAAPDPERLADQRHHVAVAREVLALARTAMTGVGEGLAREPADWEWVRSDAATGVEHLETLRRLFFSIAEHLRDVAARQVDLADETQDALARATAPDADADAEAAPLVERETGLAQQALAIATALAQQSSETAADPQAEEASKRLRQAADHVMRAQGEMEGAAGRLSPPADLAGARGAQDLAIQELAAALEILEPPGQQPQQQGPQQQDQAQQQPRPADGSEAEEEQQAGADAGEADADPQADLGQDPGQLLQEVRDREAKRRRDRSQRAPGYETVEKDW